MKATLFMLPVFFYRAFALKLLWNWFVAMPFNAPMLNLGMAVGIIITTRVIMGRVRPQSDENLLDTLLDSAITTTLALIIGGVAHYAMVLL